MDDARFDQLVKSFGTSRRGVVKAAAGSALGLAAGAVGLHVTDAAARKRAAGSICSKNVDCVSGYCGAADNMGRRHCLDLNFQSFNLNGFSCPTGATGFHYAGVLDQESAAQAEQACEQCYGHTCYFSDGDCAGPGYCPSSGNPDGEACFGYTNGCSGDDGRIWNFGDSYTTFGYWGK